MKINDSIYKLKFYLRLSAEEDKSFVYLFEMAHAYVTKISINEKKINNCDE